MKHFLEIDITVPIEREYERWILNGIESYFESLGVNYSNLAVSPKMEKQYPADEIFIKSDFKLFGLQFKKAKLAKNKSSQKGINCDRLKWSLHQPSGQFDLIKKHPEIFYCLPTFVSRDYKKRALHHCVFWRPPNKSSDKSLWYNNKSNRLKTKHNKIYKEFRWGVFIEQLVCCNIGLKRSDFTKSDYSIRPYIDSLYDELTDIGEDDNPIYLYIINNFGT